MTPIEQHPDDLHDRALLAFAKQLSVLLAPRAEDRMRDERAVMIAMSKVTRRQRRRSVRQVWLLAAAMVCVAGAAGAHRWMVRASSDAPAKAIDDAPRPSGGRQHPVAALLAPSSVAPHVESAPTDEQSGVAMSDPNETAASLFSQANDLRRIGKDDRAIPIYRKLQRLFPATPQAEQSYATLGQLSLQHLGAHEALRQFDRYLAHEGPLTEDVLVGRAIALQRLGRGNEERKTWETLLRRFPSSVHAARAKTRLADLPPVGTR